MKLGIIIDNFSIFVQNNPTVSKVAPVHHNPNPPYLSSFIYLLYVILQYPSADESDFNMRHHRHSHYFHCHRRQFHHFHYQKNILCKNFCILLDQRDIYSTRDSQYSWTYRNITLWHIFGMSRGL